MVLVVRLTGRLVVRIVSRCVQRAVKRAAEKAGIVKPGVPFVTAERNPELLELFRGIARERGAPFWVVDPLRDVREVEVARDHTSFTLHTRSWGNLRVRTPLVGRHHADLVRMQAQCVYRFQISLRVGLVKARQ